MVTGTNPFLTFKYTQDLLTLLPEQKGVQGHHSSHLPLVNLELELHIPASFSMEKVKNREAELAVIIPQNLTGFKRPAGAPWSAKVRTSNKSDNYELCSVLLACFASPRFLLTWGQQM